jgi:hypothetical protein
MEDVIVKCQRCYQPGARAYRGWQLLCDLCIADEIGEWDDRNCATCGHHLRFHGDRAITLCAFQVPITGSWYHSNGPCDCKGWVAA